MDVKQLIYQNIVHFYLLQGASEKNGDGHFPGLLFFLLTGACDEGLGCIYVSAGNVQQSVLFYSVPSSGLVLVINDKSVLVFLNVTLCDGFVEIPVLLWQSNDQCVGKFCFRLLSFPSAECCLV